MRGKLAYKRLQVSKPPMLVFLSLQENCEHAYLLESVEGPRRIARFSFIGFNPSQLLTVKNGEALFQDFNREEELRFRVKDPLELLRMVVGREAEGSELRFSGGAVGYVSYDAVRYWENLPCLAEDVLVFPDLQMGIYEDVLVFDHERGDAVYVYREKDRSNELLELISRCESDVEEGLQFTSPRANLSREEYEERVLRAKEYIESGDIFQVVLSRRYDFSVEGNLSRFYLELRKINPSPYMYFLKMGSRRIIGSSPEMLVRVEGGLIETFPIAGTRPRGATETEDEELAMGLLADPKERAEHVMLVDLARNDVGRVARFGSVHVPEFMTVHKYSHVQHIVSRVVGELRSGCDCYDVLRAVFPAGTVSGAPKVRAMEIIEECEPSRRGPYAGGVGYFSFNGNADFAITIRTLVAEGEHCSIQVGAGIVADSVPEREWLETEHKAKALLKALELAEV
ncbi:MAG: anthranilate synthase component I [Candidatus Jordarchaeales archaeon]